AGVFLVNYRLDDNEVLSAAGATMIIPVEAEGTHKLVFYSTDKLGNKEAPQTFDFTIDNTPPEIKFQFDQTKKDLVFSAVDNISAPIDIVISDQNGAVAAIDQAGNVAKLLFGEKNRKQSLRAQLSGLSYNGKTIDMKGSQLAFAWFYGYAPKIPPALTGLQALPSIPEKLPKTGNLSFLLQQAKLKDGSFIVAIYSGGKTRLLERKNKKLNLKTYLGLKLVEFETDKGKLGWGW
ncbi:MAG: hypothetical protein WCX69_04820, partial [Candidatus Paceibacterota bacterium]